MALSSKNAKPLVQLKVEAYDEAVKALRKIDTYGHFEVEGISAWHYATLLDAESQKLKTEYWDIFVN